MYWRLIGNYDVGHGGIFLQFSPLYVFLRMNSLFDTVFTSGTVTSCHQDCVFNPSRWQCVYMEFECSSLFLWVSFRSSGRFMQYKPMKPGELPTSVCPGTVKEWQPIQAVLYTTTLGKWWKMNGWNLLSNMPNNLPSTAMLPSSPWKWIILGLIFSNNSSDHGVSINGQPCNIKAWAEHLKCKVLIHWLEEARPCDKNKTVVFPTALYRLTETDKLTPVSALFTARINRQPGQNIN